MVNLSKVNFFKHPESDSQITPFVPGHDASVFKFKEILKNELNNPPVIQNKNDSFHDTPSINDRSPDINAEDNRVKTSGTTTAENKDNHKQVDDKEQKHSGKDVQTSRENISGKENIIKNTITGKESVKNKDESAPSDKDRVLKDIDILLNILKGFQARIKGADEFRTALTELKNFHQKNSNENKNDILNLKHSLAKLDALFKKLNIDMQGNKNQLRAGDGALFSELKKEAIQLIDNLKKHVEKRESGRINIVKNEAVNETTKNQANERIVANEPSRAISDDKTSSKNEDPGMNFNFFRKSAAAGTKESVQ
ncbi:MAG: hypothetical protein MUC95_07050, partial [Spirochaetes bacterium]|nr:hypothetical protein [Spirochaetota bacterium]